MEEKVYKFKAEMDRLVYSGFGDFKIYGMLIDTEEYPDIEVNKFGNVSIMGDIVKLDPCVSYEIEGTLEKGKYGPIYRVKRIRRDKPQSSDDIYRFLRSILTEDQATTLYRTYPNIIDMILNDEKVDLSITKGIKEKTFEKIKRKVLDNFAMIDIVSKYNGILSMGIIQKLFKKYTSTEMVDYKLQNAPYETLCEISRINFLTADKMILSIDQKSREMLALGQEPVLQFTEPIKTSKQRCLFGIIHILNENEHEGNTYMKFTQLKNQLSALINECIEHFRDCLNDQRIYYDVNQNIIALRYTYDTEKIIAKKLIEAYQTDNTYDIKDIDSYRKIDGKTLTDRQFCILKMLCKYNACILNGYSGSGKSQTMAAVIRMLDDYNKSYILMAPTGKAAKVLSDYTGVDACTIHRGLHYIPNGEGWGYCESVKLPFQVVVVDEISMVDVHLFRHLLEAIDFRRTKLLMVGDSAQLPSVGCGNILYDLLKSKVVPSITLDKIFRYEDGGLMKVATDIRNSECFIPNPAKTPLVNTFGNDYVFVNCDSHDYADTIKRIRDLYEMLLNSDVSPSDIQVLSSQRVGNYGCIAINNMLQTIANPNAGSTKGYKSSENTFYEGDIVIQMVNNYRAKIYKRRNMFSLFGDEDDDDGEDEVFIANGETGVVEEVLDEDLVVRFPTGTVSYCRDEVERLELGYCITVHKSQGSSAKYVIFITPRAHTFMLNSNLLYVGVTRTKKKCFQIGEAMTIKNTVWKKEDFNRQTMLKDFLMK